MFARKSVLATLTSPLPHYKFSLLCSIHVGILERASLIEQLHDRFYSQPNQTSRSCCFHAPRHAFLHSIQSTAYLLAAAAITCGFKPLGDCSILVCVSGAFLSHSGLPKRDHPCQTCLILNPPDPPRGGGLLNDAHGRASVSRCSGTLQQPLALYHY